MRKLLFVAIATFGFLVKSNAQNSGTQGQSVIGLVYPEDDSKKGSRIHFGGKVGFRLSGMSDNGWSFGSDIPIDGIDDSGLSSESILGFDFGPIITYDVSENWGLQGEFLYSFEGADFKFGDQDYGDETIEIRLQYIRIPLLAKYNFTEKISLLAGPQIGILTSAKSKFEGGDKEDIKEDMSSVIIDGVVSLQYNFIFKNRSRSAVGLRYNIGFSDAFDSEASGISAKNSGLSAFLSASF